ncbi:MAG TPA: YraN family protein [Xanthobacteraceae bacterium]|nr:YraN family protein [Xanthobacteraceae bacterium]
MTRRIERPTAIRQRNLGPSPERRAAFRRGLSAETRAAILLLVKGYRILARRWQSPVGEIDIVARRRGVLIFVEVKARARLDEAAEAVSERQRRRIAAAAQAWLAGHPEHASAEIRFDAVLVVPRRWPRHIIAAFDASP